MSLALTAGPAEPVVERRLAVMGTSLTIEVAAPTRAAALAASEAAVRAVEESERRLSTWRGDSELARLNRAPLGVPVELSASLAGELSSALACARVTGGAFEPLVAPLVAAWGLRGAGRRPDAVELARARAASGSDALQLASGRATRVRDSGVEEGGFGKGAALDRAIASLTKSGVARARLDLGGQVLLIGAHDVAIAHPDRRDDALAVVNLERGSLSTSGNSTRGVVVEGVRLGHILDPRSGEPAPDFGALVVWAERALEADCLSTGLYVLGPEAALRFAGAHDGVEVAVLERVDGGVRVRASAGLRGRMRLVDASATWEEAP